MGLLGAINGLITAGHQRRLARQIKPVNTNYTENPYIKGLYAQGSNLYQGRMAGATAAEQGIQNNAANTNATVSRNAGDASTALAVAAGVQGQADQATNNLATQEGHDKVNRFGVYSNVSQLMAQEGDKVFQDKLRNYYDDLNYKRSLEGAAMQNQQGAFNNIDSTIGAVAGYIMGPGGAIAGRGQRGGNNATPAPQYRTPGYVPTRPTFQY